ncbi:sensor histidine kinase [Sanguibacter sp. Z1732]|uniref:sensor histidine kinase n=1 Tax=Sanguibacter sp. Z1732 TaxID=3435412 RepID=UPI003D9C85DC
MTTSASASLFRWSALSNPQRFEAYNRWSFYSFLAAVPLLSLAQLAGPTPWTDAQGLTYLGVMMAHTVVCLVVASRSFDHILGRMPLPRRMLVGLAGTVSAGLVVIAAVYPGVGRAEDPRALLYAVLILLVSALLAVCPLIKAPYVAIGSGLTALVAATFAAMAGALNYIPVAGFVGLALSLSMALSMRIAVWMVLVMWDLDRRREVDARLAVAEERLRFSRDLHDVFGRTLSTVAVKSELAAALTERGDSRGIEEMEQVRSLAEDALKEVREVVQGYRAADLPTEMAGARAILTASGIEVRVAGEHLHLPAGAQRALAWVVREGVTNVVRHSRATECTLERANGTRATCCRSPMTASPRPAPR